MPDHHRPPLSASSALNRNLGWGLVVLGFAWAAGLDPWALGTAGTGESLRLAVRQAHGVLLGMGFLQLLVAWIAQRQSGTPAAVRGLTAAGALIYIFGHVLRLRYPALGWLIPLGALLNAGGFGLLFQSHARGKSALTVRLALGAVVFGMLLDAGMGLRSLLPELLATYLGPEDGVRMRMLRLARVASIALPIQAILYDRLRPNAPDRPVVRWGGLALAWGAVGMPVVLTGAALGNLGLKYLLTLPADAVLFGAGVAVWLAFQGNSWPMRGGWLLLLASMVMGQLMGGYAFDGPLPAPPAFAGYLDFARSLARIGHAYAILLGLLALFAAEVAPGPERRVGLTLLGAGTATTLLAMTLVAARLLPGGWLAPGPGLVALAAVVLVRGKVPK
jgi:hypothetical protein